MTPERDALARAIDQYSEIAAGFGLMVPEIRFEIVPAEVIHEIAAYHFPVRFPHWTHGSDYFRQKTAYDHGMSRIYELVVNTEPALAFLLEGNSLAQNKLVVAHVIGHADFFRRNVWFRDTNRGMQHAARSHGELVERYEREHGQGPVEQMLDAALALAFHVDPSLIRRKSQAEYDHDRLHPTESPRTDYDDLWDITKGRERPTVTPRRIPAEPERDILRFIAEHAGALEPWQRDLLHVVREEYCYFYANISTKVMNEGWATAWHERILTAAPDITPDETIEWRRMHAGVVAGGSRFGFNPYGLGYRVWRDIERRWDEGEVEVTWYGEERRLPSGQGMDKCFEVASQYRDPEFVRGFLAERVIEALDLYRYGHEQTRDGGDQWVVQPGDWRAVRDGLAQQLGHHGVPSIRVIDGDHRGQGVLLLQHDRTSDGLRLDMAYAERVMHHIYRLWGRPVTLWCEDHRGPLALVQDEDGWHREERA